MYAAASVCFADLEEKFAVLDSGKFGCNSCGYTYDQDKGDPSYPIPAGELMLPLLQHREF